MPFFRLIGLAPAATLRRPSRTMAHANTVAVVVPSPATSSVFLATSLTSSAPIFSYGSSSSMSLATDTPSLVMVGAPHFFSRTTFRPLGPSVTRTASASWFMPDSSERRAVSSKAISLGIPGFPPLDPCHSRLQRLSTRRRRVLTDKHGQPGCCNRRTHHRRTLQRQRPLWALPVQSWRSGVAVQEREG